MDQGGTFDRFLRASRNGNTLSAFLWFDTEKFRKRERNTTEGSFDGCSGG